MTPRSLHKRIFYRIFSFWFAIGQGWQRRFTLPGKFALWALIIASVIGINTRQAVAYQIVGFLFALIGVSLVCALVLGWRRQNVLARIERELPRYATVGVPFQYRITLTADTHANARSRAGLYLFEIPHDPRPDLHQFCNLQEPGAAKRNWFDRKVGYYRWAWLVRLNSVARIDEMALPPLPAGRKLVHQHQVWPHARGVLALDGIALATHDPFGLCRIYRIRSLPASVLVLPRTYRLPVPNLPGNRMPQAERRVSTISLGDGEDISGLREYRPGDAMRDIHWKSFARLGTPMVKEYQAEFALRHALLLDTSGDAGDAFEDAVALAASLVGDIGRGECLLDLLFVGEEAHCMTMGPGELQAEALLRVLAGVVACPGQSLAPLLANLASRRAELSGCICLLLGWDTPRRHLIDALQALGLPLMVWLVSAQKVADCPPWVMQFQPGQIEEGLARL
jgi:uncharacterized protein (DUF58 family)